MKKTIKKTMRLQTETIRNLTLSPARLRNVGGGLETVPCGTHGCTLSGCCPDARGKVASAACQI
jgi:hypothetical protein